MVKFELFRQSLPPTLIYYDPPPQLMMFQKISNAFQLFSPPPNITVGKVFFYIPLFPVKFAVDKGWTKIRGANSFLGLRKLRGAQKLEGVFFAEGLYIKIV